VSKYEVLTSLARLGEADAAAVAEDLAEPFATVSMALLRAVCQGLAVRYADPDAGVYRYMLSPHGERRLAYFRHNT
jgi:DNA-binding MarR family transcriptional regulator